MAAGNLIVGLDIGTMKIAVVVAEASAEGEVQIVGVGTSVSEGIKKGVVVNIDDTVNSIRKAVKDAEQMAGVDIHAVYAGIAGDHVRSINSKGFIAVSRQDKEITQEDVDRVIGAAKTVGLPMDREIIHVLPQEFVIDDQGAIKQPVGMSGVRLEVEVHIVTGAFTSAQNLKKCIRRAGLDVRDLVLEPLASSFAVLTPDEEELGVALIDIGGGTTDLIIVHEKSIRHTSVTALGGKNVTSDITVGLRVPLDEAEEIKKKHGSAIQDNIREDAYFSVVGVGEGPSRQVSKRLLASMIEPRMEEILELVQKDINKTEYADLLTSGIVITGGGAGIAGLRELAEHIFKVPVRIGNPKGFGGLMDSIRVPAYSTGIGLIHYGLKYREKDKNLLGIKRNNAFEKFIAGIKHWFEEFF